MQSLGTCGQSLSNTIELKGSDIWAFDSTKHVQYPIPKMNFTTTRIVIINDKIVLCMGNYQSNARFFLKKVQVRISSIDS